MDKTLPGTYPVPVKDLRRIGGAMLVVAAVGAAPGPAIEDQPQLELNPPELNLGAVLDLEPIDQSVVVRNASAEPAQILEIRDSCGGCVGYELSAVALDPGEEAVLRLRVDPMGHRGPLSVMVVVATTELDRPQRGFRLTADIVPGLSATGVPVSFPEMSPDQMQRWRVKLVPQVELAAPFTRIVSDLEGLSGTVTYDEARDVYWADIVAGPGLALGHHPTLLRVVTDDPWGLTFPIPVHLPVVPALDVAPRELVLDRMDREQLRILFVNQRRPAPARIASVESSDPRIRPMIIPDTGLAAQRINLYGYGLSQAVGPIGAVTVHFAGDELNPVTIPMYVQDLQGVVIEPTCEQSNRVHGGAHR